MSKPPFIGDQGWSLLTDFEHPQQHLHTSDFRTGRPAAGFTPSGAEEKPTPWLPVDRLDVLANTLKLPNIGWVDCSRLVITTDAGLGKSVAIDWLRAGMFHPGLKRRRVDQKPGPPTVSEVAGWMAFNVPRRVLLDGTPEQVHQRLLDYMAQETHSKLLHHGATLDDCRKLVKRQRRWGRVLLLFDGLDQMGDVEALAQVIGSEFWRHCHIVIAGRPNALQSNWALFNDSRWRFIRVEEFTPDQQQRYLGDDREGKPKLKRIPQDALPILTVPRVLHYIRELPETKLAQLQSAADVYYQAICELIKRGMQESQEAREMDCDGRIPTNPQTPAIFKAFQLLSLIAFDMVSHPIRRDGPNFYRVKRGKMPAMLDRLKARFPTRDFNRDWRALAALNSVLTHAVFDADVQGLVELEFRNRSLQEFLCAYYLAQHAEESDRRHLYDWIYLQFEPETIEYYYIWQFLAEMPDDAVDESVWLESIEPVYRPAIQDADGRWRAKRSNEILFRSWPRVHHLCEQGDPRAIAIREQWRSEFENIILTGQHGEQARRRGVEFQDSFLKIDADTFVMGTPDDKQGQMSKEHRQFFERFLREAPVDNPDPHIQRTLNRIRFAYGPSGDKEREGWENLLRRVLSGGIDAAERAVARRDEHQHSVKVAAFKLSRSPCLNAWYRLFDPTHGENATVVDDYRQFSESPDQPAIYLTWFDAWAFCQWARWGGQSCRWPWEDEWEYACKGGQHEDWRYWWGDEFDGAWANANRSLGRTNIPDERHANPMGLRDMIGNVWEWCQDRYRRKHSPMVSREQDEPGDAQGFRVLRGGSFDFNAVNCRASCRVGRPPTFCSYDVGLRVARA